MAASHGKLGPLAISYPELTLMRQCGFQTPKFFKIASSRENHSHNENCWGLCSVRSWTCRIGAGIGESRVAVQRGTGAVLVKGALVEYELV